MTEDEIFDAVAARVESGHQADVPDAYPQEPATEEAVADAERIIGYPLPPLLRRLYLEVANGGFGPFNGIEGVADGYAAEEGMLENYLSWRVEDLPDDFPAWTPGVVAFCDFGCAMWALLDCRTPEGRVQFLDQSTLHRLDLPLARWFELWLADDNLDMHKLITA
ncbi:SMI1/KNR4 family protein [Actinoplanes friuliensis]|uniref:Knr4/Smi1-like domain-containing protein n=1 Tax=Actinoplanes friuliensis DSM 7358 TaxID=1246995 RepID=U5VVR7_9ACTN|nr:SMI1/KNR4 family protein [Actinoplanes friuliensis]AGZ40969.1 hypothetical protein AFR_13415 [Actinoplanes friuliensis DSM 7358]